MKSSALALTLFCKILVKKKGHHMGNAHMKSLVQKSLVITGPLPWHPIMQACSSVALTTNPHQHMAWKPHFNRNTSIACICQNSIPCCIAEMVLAARLPGIAYLDTTPMCVLSCYNRTML